MTEREAIESVANKASISKKAAKEAVNALKETIEEELLQGGSIRFQGLGTFMVTERAERTGINPMTKEKIQIGSTKNVKFRPSTTLKDRLNSKTD